MLSAEEQERYKRQLKLSEVGFTGQQKLKDASVLVIGAGGLGCPVLQYLTAAGVGRIGVVDGDTVDYSNLQRQILFDTTDVGKSKGTAAVEKLKRQNEWVSFEVYNEFLSKENALDILSSYDVIIDGTDNFEARYLIGDATVVLNKPLVFGSIFRFEGQVSVFNYQNGPSYRCLYPDPPNPTEVPNCSEVGVIGVLPGVIGTTMANEAIKIILGIGNILSGKLQVTNLLENRMLTLSIQRQDSNFTRTVLEDEYRFSCDIDLSEINEVHSKTLKQWLDAGENIKLLDVRESHEYAICHIEGSELIPLSVLNKNRTQVSRDIPTIVICHHGVRSKRAIELLINEGYTNLINLSGGIDAWAVDVDNAMLRY